MTASKMKIAGPAVLCVLLLGAGLTGLRAYQAPPPASAENNLSSAKAKLEALIEKMRAEEEAVARLRREKTKNADGKVVDAVNRAKWRDDLDRQRAQVKSAEARLNTAKSTVVAARDRVASLSAAAKVYGKKADPHELALAEALLKRHDAEVAVAEAMVRIERLTLEELSRNIESKIRADARASAVAKSPPASLEARVEKLEETVRKLVDEVKALRAGNKKGSNFRPDGSFDPFRAN